MYKVVSMILIFSLTACGGGESGGSETTKPVTPPIEPPIQPPVPPPSVTNRAPVIKAISPITLQGGESKDYQVQASDADGDVIHFALINAPSWVKINNNTGILTLTPSAAHAGTHSINLTASDGKLTTQAEVTINVIVAQATTKPSAIPSADLSVNYNANRVTLNWGNFTGNAAFFHVTSEQDPIGNHTELAQLEFELPTAPTRYFVAACNNAGCSTPTAIAVKGQSDLASLSLTVLALEPEQKVDLTLSLNNKFHQDKAFSAGVDNNPISNTAFVGDEISLVVNSTTNNQICHADASNITLRAGNNTINIDCKTAVTASFVSNYKTYDAALNRVDIDMPIVRNSNGLPITSPSIAFSSSAPDIAEVAGNQLKIKSLGNTVITATPAADYYTYDQAATYRATIYKVPDNKVEICQSNNCVDINSQFFSIVGGRKVLTRFYGLNGDFKLDINNSVGNLYSTTFSCASTAPNSVSFELNETCNLEIPAQYVQNNTQWLLKDATGQDIALFMPNIQGAKKWIVTLVKVRVNLTNGEHVIGAVNEEGETEAQTLAKIKQRLEDRFPFSEIDVRIKEEPMVFAKTVDEVGQADFNSIIQQLRYVRQTDLGLGNWDQVNSHYYHALAPHYAQYSGLAYIGVGVGTSLDAKVGNFQANTKNCQANLEYCSVRYLQTLTHELGHSLDLLHSPCATPPGQGDDWAKVPWLKGSNGALNEKTPLFDQTINLLRTPNHIPGSPFFDVMGYCDGQYFSEYNTQNILNFTNQYATFTPTQSKTRTAAEHMPTTLPVNRFKQITWVINSTNDIYFSPITFSQTKNPKQDNDYKVRATLEDGSVYIAHPYSLAFVHDTATREFIVDVPVDFNITHFDVIDNQQHVIYSTNLEPSSAAPRVQQNKNTLYFFNENTQYPYVDVYELTDTGSVKLLLLNSTDKQLELTNSNPVRVVFKNEFNYKEAAIE